MSKNYLMIIAVMIILIIGYLFLSKRGATSPTTNVATTEQRPTSQNIITYTNQGFIPQQLTVKKGQAVIFTNSGNSPMWVASDPHPQHTGLPGFDAKKAMQKGESYSFTFDTVGHWGFHNHLTPSDAGTIIVQE